MKIVLHFNTVNQLHMENAAFHFLVNSVLYSDCQNRGPYMSAHVLLIL